MNQRECACGRSIMYYENKCHVCMIEDWNEHIYGSTLHTAVGYQDIPRRLKLRGYEVSTEEYQDRPGMLTVTLWHPRYTRWRKRRYERTLAKIRAYIMENKVVGTQVYVRLEQGPKTKPDWYMHPIGTLPPQHPRCRCTPATISVDDKDIGVAEFRDAVIDYASQAYHVPRAMLEERPADERATMPTDRELQQMRRAHIEFTNAQVNVKALEEMFGIKTCRCCGNIMERTMGFDGADPDNIQPVHGWHCKNCGALMFPGEPKLMQLTPEDYVTISACGTTKQFLEANPAIAEEIKKAVVNYHKRRLTTGEWVEKCDECGKILDMMNGEDFYIEEENKVLCEKHYAEWGKRNHG